ncbi:MAG: hypothetical protein ACO1OK_06450, partial [Devosia sp.]
HLREQGHDTARIAEMVGIPRGVVSALEHSAARSRKRAGDERQELGRMVLLPQDLIAALRRPAAKRGVSANQLARMIVEAVSDGKLIDAVLDDAEEVDG